MLWKRRDVDEISAADARRQGRYRLKTMKRMESRSIDLVDDLSELMVMTQFWKNHPHRYQDGARGGPVYKRRGRWCVWKSRRR